MSTIREWLNNEGFDWDKGIIIYHPVTEDSYSPGWGERGGASVQIEHGEHPILDQEFDSGYGAPQCPRFIAFDTERIYFPWQYDGATGLDFIYRNPDFYLGDDAVATPYPGG